MRTLVVAMARMCLLGMLVLSAQLAWSSLSVAAPPTPDRLDVDFSQPPTPTLVEWPTLSPFVEPPRSGIALPSWPWSSETPSWDDAQAHPQEYVQWLKERNPGKNVKAVTALVTAYCPCAICCGSSADGLTRSNRSAYRPGLAVAEPVYRRKLSYHVPGYFFESFPGKAWTPDDTGSAMLRSYADGVLHIDVRYQNHDWARSKGMRTGTVFIIR